MQFGFNRVVDLCNRDNRTKGSVPPRARGLSRQPEARAARDLRLSAPGRLIPDNARLVGVSVALFKSTHIGRDLIFQNVHTHAGVKTIGSARLTAAAGRNRRSQSLGNRRAVADGINRDAIDVFAQDDAGGFIASSTRDRNQRDGLAAVDRQRSAHRERIFRAAGVLDKAQTGRSSPGTDPFIRHRLDIEHRSADRQTVGTHLNRIGRIECIPTHACRCAQLELTGLSALSRILTVGVNCRCISIIVSHVRRIGCRIRSAAIARIVQVRARRAVLSERTQRLIVDLLPDGVAA